MIPTNDLPEPYASQIREEGEKYSDGYNRGKHYVKEEPAWTHDALTYQRGASTLFRLITEKKGEHGPRVWVLLGESSEASKVWPFCPASHDAPQFAPVSELAQARALHAAEVAGLKALREQEVRLSLAVENQLTAAREQNAKLRAALEKIALKDGHRVVGISRAFAVKTCNHWLSIAREALSSSPEAPEEISEEDLAEMLAAAVNCGPGPQPRAHVALALLCLGRGKELGRLAERKSLLDGGWTATVLEDLQAKLTAAGEREKRLVDALEKAHRHCQHTGEGHAELGRMLREALREAQGEKA